MKILPRSDDGCLVAHDGFETPSTIPASRIDSTNPTTSRARSFPRNFVFLEHRVDQAAHRRSSIDELEHTRPHVIERQNLSGILPNHNRFVANDPVPNVIPTPENNRPVNHEQSSLTAKKIRKIK